mmetsp:Transcript_21351/g.60913  ORF Transcript_21351/g.60913 Transcript_21351/m.60913 type:complete len:290 (-) Transcript_21351:37-906(-)
MLHVHAPEDLEAEGQPSIREAACLGEARPHAAVQYLGPLGHLPLQDVARESLGERAALVEQQPHAELELGGATEEPPRQEPARHVQNATTGADANAEQQRRDEEDGRHQGADGPASPRAARHRSLEEGVRDARPDLGAHVLPGNLTDGFSAVAPSLHQLFDPLLHGNLRQQQRGVFGAGGAGGRGRHRAEAARGGAARRRRDAAGAHAAARRVRGAAEGKRSSHGQRARHPSTERARPLHRLGRRSRSLKAPHLGGGVALHGAGPEPPFGERGRRRPSEKPASPLEGPG